MPGFRAPLVRQPDPVVALYLTEEKFEAFKAQAFAKREANDLRAESVLEAEGRALPDVHHCCF